MRDQFADRNYQEWYEAGEGERKQVFEEYKRLIEKRKREITAVLDLGCGCGGFLDIWPSRRSGRAGIDLSKIALNKAKEKLGSKAILIKLDVVEKKLPFAQNSFDLVTLIDVPEILVEPKDILNKTKKVLRKKGLIFISQPFLGGLMGWLITKDGVREKIRHQDSQFWQRSLGELGFVNVEIVKIVFFGLPPLVKLREGLRKLGLPVSEHFVPAPNEFLAARFLIFGRK